MNDADDGRLRELLRRAIYERFGLVFFAGREEAFERGIERAAALTGGSLPMLLARVQGDHPATLAALADELTIAETYFFREPQHFTVVDAAVERAASEGRQVRLWSAGCATGEEAYSLAIRALDAARPSNTPVHVLGTDLAPRAIAAASAAAYRPWSFRGMSDELQRRWFERSSEGSRPTAAVRQVVRFARKNLVELDSATEEMDVIFCRNVFIYLDAAAIARATETLIRSLAAGGVLVLGPSDPLLDDPRLALDSTGGFLTYSRMPVEAPRLGTQTSGDSAGSAWKRASVVPARSVPPRASSSSRPTAVTLGERLSRGRALADRGELSSARAVLEDAGADPDTIILRALVAQGLGDHEAALRDARALTTLDSPPALALVIEAMALVESGELEPARQVIARARESLSGSAPATDLGHGAIVADLLLTLHSLETRAAPQRRRRRSEG